MGLDNRDYMRKKPDSFGSVRGFEISGVTLLLLLNCAVWLAWQIAAHSPRQLEFMRENFFCSIDNAFTHWRLHTLFTCAISHIDAKHVLFNMLFFWFLGGDVEIFYGRRNFLLLYFFAGIAAALAQCGVNALLGADIPMLGASGAVMGIAVCAAFIDPQKPMLLMGFVPMKLWLLVGLYILMDLSGVLAPGSGGGIAHAAHLGGALAGLIFYKFDLRLFSTRGKLRVIEGGTQRVSTEKQRAELHASWKAPRESPVDSASAKRVDELLAKISKDGMNALTADERAFLQDASEKYKR